MRYASVCSGVEAASLAWMPLGWEPVWFSEIEPFPCEVLKQRFPGVQNLGDMTKIDGEKYRGTVDLLVGGTPCQGFSVAGKQGGLDDPRSALCLAYCRLLGTMRPRWFVWENVPGVFSTNGGEDFKAFLRKIDEIGYSCAWRVLDAQYIRVDGYPRAVPQRRRRVFVVGYLGEWRYPASVLFEPGCLHRDTPPRRTPEEETPGGAGRGAQTAGFRAMSIGNGQAGELGCANDSIAQTLHCMHDQQAVLCYENHAQDSRIKEIDCSPVISAKAGTGGGNLPLVQHILYDNQTRAREPKSCGDVSCCLQAAIGMAGNNLPLEPHKQPEEVNDADAKKRNPVEILSILRKEIGEENFRNEIGRLRSIYEKEVLQSTVHGDGVRCKADNNNGKVNMSIPCTEDCPIYDMRDVWCGKCNGCPPQGQGFYEQCSGELNASMSQMSQSDSCKKEDVCNMRNTAKGTWLLRKALGKIQEIRQPASVQTQSVRHDTRATVRRLLVVEAERLMGFPDDHTRIPWRGKPAEKCPDSPRYKACGNSMCVNVMRWIGMRIENVERKMK